MGATDCAAHGSHDLLVGLALCGAASQLAREDGSMETQDVTNDDYARTLDELDRLLNDPDVPMQPALIWRLVDEVSEHDLQAGTMLSPAAPGLFHQNS